MTNLATRRARFACFLVLTMAMARTAWADAGTAPPEFVAGLEPSRRPTAAPVQREAVRAPDWRDRAMRGIGEPTAGLRFIEDQGGWYTPFVLPGMTDRYDLRGWHDRPPRP